MPYHVDKSARCPASRPWGVIKDSDGSVLGCHASKKAATAQMAAVLISESEVNMSNPAPPRENLYRAMYPGVELRSETNGPPHLTGHFAVFNRWTEINSIFEGRFLERISPGAFTKTIAESLPSMRVLFQHGRDPQIGDKPLGSIDTLAEDKIGAAYDVSLLDTSYNKDLIPGLEAGLYGASFRFKVMKEEFVNEPGKSDYNPGGLPERTIKEAAVNEFGPVTFPAYAEATAGIRSLTDEFILETFIRDPQRAAQIVNTIVPAHALSNGAEKITPVEESRAPDIRPLVVIRNPNRERKASK